MTAELVGPLPTITYYGAGPRVTQAYTPPRNTHDLRARLCTDHHPACDCREALHAETVSEHRDEWQILHDAARSALAGHQLDYPLGLSDIGRLRFRLCLCSGCSIERATHNLVGIRDIDFRTGRVREASQEVPF